MNLPSPLTLVTDQVAFYHEKVEQLRRDYRVAVEQIFRDLQMRKLEHLKRELEN